MMTIDLVDTIDEQINLFGTNYGTDIIAVFPDKKEIYVRDMAQFLKSFFADWDDEVFVDVEHNMRIKPHSVLTGTDVYQVFLQDDFTGYTIIGEYELASDAKEAIENCHGHQYYVSVAMNFELILTVTASSLSEAEDAAYQYCADTMQIEQRYSSNEQIEDWDVTDSNIEVTSSELA